MIEAPYVLFLGDAPDRLAAKTAIGIARWRPDRVVGQIRLDGCQADAGVPDRTLQEAVEAGAKTLVIGVANRGGRFSDAWKDVLTEALAQGLDLAAGLHARLAADADIRQSAERHGRRLHDVRVPPDDLPIATGARRTGKRCLAVGTDCSIGKMYTALAMDAEMKSRGMKSAFRATGQTGILIAGEGVPIDAVVADFMAGAVEALSPAADDDHWDHIEGQGSLFHPSYSGVTTALLHGGQADALILCHEPTRTHLRGLEHYGMPTLGDLRDLALTLAKVVNPDVRVAGVALNGSELDDAGARDEARRIEDAMDLPCVDPHRDGAGRLVDAVLA